MDDDWGGCIVAIIVICLVIGLIGAIIGFGAMALVYSGLTAILAVEFVARGFGSLGVADPIVAWVLVGVLVGAVVGYSHGFRKAGRPSTVRFIWAGGTLIVLLLLIPSWQASTVPVTNSVLPATSFSSPCTYSSSSEWHGNVRGTAADLKIMPSGSYVSCAATIDYGGVLEKLSVAFSSNGSMVLTGRSFRRLSGNGIFNLDTFSGQLSIDGQQVSGTYVDHANSRGAWRVSRFVEPTAIEPSATQSQDSNQPSSAGSGPSQQSSGTAQYSNPFAQNAVPAPNVKVSDSQIEMEVAQAIRASEALKNDRITTATTQAQVILSGSVASDADRQLAESIAAKIPGVIKVSNELVVDNAPAFLAQAEEQFDHSQYKEALASCDAALQLDPRNPAAIQLKEKISETVKILGPQHATQTNSTVQSMNVQQWLALAESQFEGSNFNGALRSCNVVLQIDPNNSQAIKLKEKVEATMKILGDTN